jgi:tetratricopeptide (TPR) repeat protein
MWQGHAAVAPCNMGGSCPTETQTPKERSPSVPEQERLESSNPWFSNTLTERLGRWRGQWLPYLESLTKSAPANPAVLYNLVMSYSELGQFDEAIIRLQHAVQLDPGHAHAWVGIGNAYHRMGKHEQALEGVGTDEADEESDALYKRFIEEHPTAPMVGKAEKSRTAFGNKRLKSGSVGGFRPDVMLYTAGALQTFKKLGPAKRHEVAVEIAILGRSGLDINDPTNKYKLKTLPGKFTGLHLLASMFTAFRQIDPTMETGADFGAEYEAALQIQEK